MWSAGDVWKQFKWCVCRNSLDWIGEMYFRAWRDSTGQVLEVSCTVHLSIYYRDSTHPWKSLNYFLLNSRPWKYLKTGQVLESRWISFHRSLKVLEFSKSNCASQNLTNERVKLEVSKEYAFQSYTNVVSRSCWYRAGILPKTGFANTFFCF